MGLFDIFNLFFLGVWGDFGGCLGVFFLMFGGCLGVFLWYFAGI
jgi:hypothetical protein